jgi:hypothetical protein
VAVVGQTAGEKMKQVGHTGLRKAENAESRIRAGAFMGVFDTSSHRVGIILR